MPSKTSPIIRHHHPGPNPAGNAALAAARDVVMRRAMEAHRREKAEQQRSVSKPA